MQWRCKMYSREKEKFFRDTISLWRCAPFLSRAKVGNSAATFRDERRHSLLRCRVYDSRTMSEANPVAARSEQSRLLIYFLVEYLCSVGQPLLTMGIFFFTHNKLGWGLRANLLLAMGEGAV